MICARDIEITMLVINMEIHIQERTKSVGTSRSPRDKSSARNIDARNNEVLL